jgi:hypothetical protein
VFEAVQIHQKAKAAGCVHLDNYISAYNFGRRVKTLRCLTPYEFICKQWTIELEWFTLNPFHQMPGLNIGHRPYPVANESGKTGLSATLKNAPEGRG